MTEVTNLKLLREQRRRLAECFTFEAFLKVQLDYFDTLIKRFEASDELLKQAARTLLRFEDKK